MSDDANLAAETFRKWRAWWRRDPWDCAVATLVWGVPTFALAVYALGSLVGLWSWS